MMLPYLVKHIQQNTQHRFIKNKRFKIMIQKKVICYLNSMADPEILKSDIGTNENVSAPSSFIANAHNELHC